MEPIEVTLYGTITGIDEPETIGETRAIYPTIMVEISPNTAIKAMITPQYAEVTQQEFIDTYSFINREHVIITAELERYPFDGDTITAKTMQHA